jgi:hypothetical protein
MNLAGKLSVGRTRAEQFSRQIHSNSLKNFEFSYQNKQIYQQQKN